MSLEEEIDEIKMQLMEIKLSIINIEEDIDKVWEYLTPPRKQYS